MKRIFKKLAIAGLASIGLFSFASCSEEEEIDTVTVTIGVCGGNNLHWNACQKVLDEQESGIIIELKSFSAYNLPNDALNKKEIDLNSFQHQVYLDNEVKTNGYAIETIGESLIAPLTIYSKSYKSLEELKNGNGEKKIGIPSDPTNLGRALKVLESAGLITVDESVGYLPETKDITSNPYNLSITPQSADSLTSVYSDYAACLINGTYAIPYGLVPSKDGLYTESQDTSISNPYNNVIVARTEDKNNRIYKKIVKAFQSQMVAEFIVANYNEAFIPVFEYSKDFTYYNQNDSTSKQNFIDEITNYKSIYLN